MALRPCPICGTRFTGRACTAYWVWYALDGDRICYRVQACGNCTADQLSGILTAVHESHDLDTCPTCGTRYQDGITGLYCTLYLPGEAARRYEFALCADCLAKLTPSYQAVGIRQSNRAMGGVPSAQAPQPQDERLDRLKALIAS